MKEKMLFHIKRNRSSLFAGFIFLVIFLGIILFPQDESEPVQQKKLFEEGNVVNKICELATLKSYYHNVAMYEKEPEGGDKFVNNVLLWPFGSYTNIGYKQFWLEYSGIVEMGIEADKIQISEPNIDGVVEVFLPAAKVMNVYVDDNTLTDPITETGWFTSISAEEKKEAFSAAQDTMRQEAGNDKVLLERANENAKRLIERYIVNTGKLVGMELSVKYIDISTD